MFDRDVIIDFEELCRRLKIKPPHPIEMGLNSFRQWDELCVEEKRSLQNEWFAKWMSNKSPEEAKVITGVIVKLMCDTDPSYKLYLLREARKAKKALKKVRK